MSRTGSDHTSADRLTDQGDISDHVDQFMTCRFVIEYKRLVIDIT